MTSKGMIIDTESVIARGNALQDMLEEERVMEGIEFLTIKINPIPLNSIVVIRTAEHPLGHGRRYHTMHKSDTSSDVWSSEQEFNDKIEASFIEWALLEDMNDD